MSAGNTMIAPRPDPTIHGRSRRATLLAWARPAIAASIRRHCARGVRLDTIAFFVLDLRDELALVLADGIWVRFGGPRTMDITAIPGPPIVIGAVPVHILADVAANAGLAYAEAAAALRNTLLPEHVHVVIAAAGGVNRGAIEHRIEQPAEAAANAA